MHRDIDRILLSEDEILRGIERVAKVLTEECRGLDLATVCVLKGSCIFVADLIRRIQVPMSLSFAYVESYGDGTVPGELKTHLMPADDEVRGKHVLLLDDILDSGRTLTSVKEQLLQRGAVDVRTCVFLDKPTRRAVEFEADHVCFEIADLFVVGYGLDYAGRYRNLPFVGALRSDIYSGASVTKR